MRQYSPDRVTLTWTSPNFVSPDFQEGFADGTFITEALDSPKRWTRKPNGVGGVTRLRVPNRGGTLSVTADRESKLHQSLKKLLIQDEALQNVVGLMTMVDHSSGEEWLYVNAFIEDEPNEQRGSDSPTVTWMFGFERRIPVPASGDENLIGT